MNILGYFYLIGNFAKKISQIGVVLIILLLVVSAFIPQSSFTPLANQTNSGSEYGSITQLRLDAVEAEFAKMEESTISAPLVGMLRGLNCKFAGVLCADKSISQDAHFAGSLMGYASLGVLYPLANPPASSAYYASDVLQNAGFVDSAYAWEGIGFSGLRAYLDIWVLFRNLAYMIFVIVLIVAGFAIMFQWKIGGKTAVTLENALVKIVFAMIVINFSYAIAGFMIDLMYVVMGILVSFLGQGILVNGQPADSAYIAGLTNDFLNAQSSQVFWSLFGDGELNGNAKDWFSNGSLGVGGLVSIASLLSGWTSSNVPNEIVSIFVVPYRIAISVISVVPMMLRWLLGLVNIYITGWIAARLSGLADEGIFRNLLNLAFGTVSPGTLTRIGTPITFLLSFVLFLGFGLPLLLAAIIMVTFFIFFVRILTIVFFTYIQIILSVITAPLLLMTDAIPGQNRFANWIKGLIGQLSTFPVLVGTFLLARMIASRADLFQVGLVARNLVGDDPTKNLWTPPFLGDGYLNLPGGGSVQVNSGLDTGAFLFIVAMVIMFSAPEFVKLTKKAIGGGGSPIKFSPMALFGAAGVVSSLPTLYNKSLFFANFFPKPVRDKLSKFADKLENKGGDKSVGETRKGIANVVRRLANGGQDAGSS